jgi:hypothetical protein
VAPKAIHQEPAKYPEGATGPASVVLEVLVGEDGAVKDVTVKDGAEPFATAAIVAARQYRFTPASRGDRIVAARIRMVVEFTPEHDEPAPPTTGDNGSEASQPAATIEKPQPQPPPAERIEEVRIEGVRSPPQESATEHKMARADIRLVPGAFGDPFRAIDALPGVVPTISGLPYYYIRGAPPSAVGYFIDDVRVPYLFHFALGPGVIQPALVDQVTMHPAAFPGRFGRYAGAIVAGTTRPPPSELYGEGNIRVFDAGAYVEAPFADGRASAGVGGRYSYTAALFSIVAKDTTIDYRDYNARASYQINKDWRATMFAFGSYDYASQMQNQPNGSKIEDVLFASEFHRLDLRLDRAGDDGSDSRIGMTFGVDRTRIEAARFAQDFVFGVRGRHLAKVSKELDVEVGMDTTIDHYTGDLPSPYAVSDSDYTSAVSFFAPRTDTATGAWVSGLWHWRGGVELTATMRGDVYTSAGHVELGPSPRVSMKVPLDRRTRFLGAMGVGAQPPTFSIPIPAVGYRGLPGGIGYGWQKSMGVERDLPLHFTARAMGFHHSYFNLRDFARNSDDLSFDKPVDVPSSPTQAFGLELYIHRNLSERVGAFASYTLSRAVIGSEEAVGTKAGLPSRISPFDRTHVFQIGGAIYIGAGWTASSRFLTYRGWPDEGNNAVSGVTHDRLDPFWRIDARIEKRWKWRKAGYISLVIEALNASAQKEIVSRSCDTLGNTTVCKNNEIGPVTAPSIGVEGAL